MLYDFAITTTLYDFGNPDAMPMDALIRLIWDQKASMMATLRNDTAVVTTSLSRLYCYHST
jgi:hypothetical protein